MNAAKPKTATALPELMSVSETAEYFRVTPSAIYARILRKTIPYTRLGFRYYILRADVAAELQRNRREVRRWQP